MVSPANGAGKTGRPHAEQNRTPILPRSQKLTLNGLRTRMEDPKPQNPWKKTQGKKLLDMGGSDVFLEITLKTPAK